MTIRECSRLQSMGGLKYLPETREGAFKALGNAVNVEVVRRITECLLACDSDKAEVAGARDKGCREKSNRQAA